MYSPRSSGQTTLASKKRCRHFCVILSSYFLLGRPKSPAKRSLQAQAASLPSYLIQKIGRWKSFTFSQYIKISTEACNTISDAFFDPNVLTISNIKQFYNTKPISVPAYKKIHKLINNILYALTLIKWLYNISSINLPRFHLVGGLLIGDCV